MLHTLLNLFIAFAKIGIVGYGGGPAMIPLIQEETVEGQKWLSEEEFLDTLAMGYTLPGPIATKMSFFIGYKVGNGAGGAFWGWVGAFVGLIGLLLPSLTLMMVLGLLFIRFKDTPYVAKMLVAIRPVVFALLAFTAYGALPKGVKSWDTALIAIVAFVAVAIFNLHPALAILVAAVLGLIFPLGNLGTLFK